MFLSSHRSLGKGDLGAEQSDDATALALAVPMDAMMSLPGCPGHSGMVMADHEQP